MQQMKINNHKYGCNVECYGNGCVGLTLECVNGTGTDDCPMFEVDCDYAQYDEIICPDGYTPLLHMGIIINH